MGKGLSKPVTSQKLQTEEQTAVIPKETEVEAFDSPPLEDYENTLRSLNISGIMTSLVAHPLPSQTSNIQITPKTPALPFLCLFQ